MKKTWALKLVGRHTLNDKKLGPVINFPRTVKLLQTEHARAVRIVRREIKALALRLREAERDMSDRETSMYQYAAATVGDILDALTKGRV